MAAETFTLEEFGERLAKLAEVRGHRAGIGVNDPEAARYARVLEFGSVVGQPPWPSPGSRTIGAVDPETGTEVVVSAQAPQGYIRVRVPEFVETLRTELRGSLNWLDPASLERHVRDAVMATTSAALSALRATVPSDSGQLRNSLTVVAQTGG